MQNSNVSATSICEYLATSARLTTSTQQNQPKD